MTTMYERTLQLPIFQGLSNEQLTEIFEKIPFSFVRFDANEVIFVEGEPCECVNFVLSGNVRMTVPMFENRVKIILDYEGPYTMPFYYLFGSETRYTSRLETLSPVGLMQVSKGNFLTMLQTNHIALVNVMNMLSAHAQKQHLAFNFAGNEDFLKRLTSCLLALSDHRASNTIIEAHENDWGMMLRMDVPVFWRSVATLEGMGIIETEGNRLRITDRYALRQFLANHS